MPKKKKTRKQKMHTDQRRQMALPATPVAKQERETPPSGQAQATQDNTFSLPTTYSFTSPTKAPQSTPVHTATIATSDYHYLRRDLIKTLALTSSIITLELLIRYFVTT